MGRAARGPFLRRRSPSSTPWACSLLPLSGNLPA
ncbi:hypothetical protein PanWU01x14_193900 [Parasponia andersonii]|uniref:Uncharacterized protein n=1 Tax=Parasponia andersonii TaxID=3476 RepID=A0A2P5C0V8_PARAD|nr:hypothetical protein PanWU01x14_193900 [Parasponia andersonii]